MKPQSAGAEIISLEDARRQYRRLQVRWFGWYALGYSTIFLWVELYLLLFCGAWFIQSLETMRVICLGAVVVNPLCSVFGAACSVRRGRRQEVEGARYFATRFHPVASLVWLPILGVRLVSWLGKRRESSSSRRRWLWEDDNWPA